MLLSTTVIILREVLEGAILMSVLLALSTHRGLHLRWSWPALILGFAGALVYAIELETISTWFDYVGQEIVNAALHVIIVLFLAGFALLYHLNDKRHTNKIIIIMTVAVSLTIVREGSEILLYLSGYLDNSNTLPSVALGSIMGAGIGMSIGALLYYTLTCFLHNYAKNVAYILLSLFSAGMLSHAATMLTQADWLPAQHTLWDTSSWLAEDSLLGQLLYAIMGYEATPTAIQLIAYISGALLLLVLPVLFEKGAGLYAKNR